MIVARMATATISPTTDERVERLSAASLRRVIDPDRDVPGQIGPGPVLPRELLSVADLGLVLSDDQWTKLSREEAASIFDAGVRFEATLMAGFGFMLARQRNLADPRSIYILHEVGEESRHSRMFIRVIGQLAPTAQNPFARGLFRAFDRVVLPRIVSYQALFCVLVLTGEEGPDLIQKRTSEHATTDPFLREVNRYHRMEEARHLSFARMLLPELWANTSFLQHLAVRHLAPAIMAGIFDSLVHPGVYRSVGLPGWRTWNAARNSESRRQLKAEAFQPILAVLRDAGAFGRRHRVPRSWRKLCRVDIAGRPTGATSLTVSAPPPSFA